MKTCTKCGLTKELRRFYKGPNKHQSRCMDCTKMLSNQKYAETKAKYVRVDGLRVLKTEWEAQNAIK